MKDEWAIVLDFLSHGHAIQARSHPIAQVIGEEYFNLLEIVPREDIKLNVLDRVYIGQGKRDQIKSISERITSSKLTATAHSELESVVKDLVNKNKKKFVNFFNEAGAVTTRQHQLELLPGIGKKHMWEILDERKKKPFKDFNDLKKRVSLLPDPEKAVIKRILEELDGTEKWYLFVSPPKREY